MMSTGQRHISGWTYVVGLMCILGFWPDLRVQAMQLFSSVLWEPNVPRALMGDHHSCGTGELPR
jgi:hypothetical protein